MQVSFEAPPGVKQNLQRTYNAWGPSGAVGQSPLQAQLLFMLAWFHAIVQERRSYIPQVRHSDGPGIDLCHYTRGLLTPLDWRFHVAVTRNPRHSVDIAAVTTVDGNMPHQASYTGHIIWSHRPVQARMCQFAHSY